MINAALFYGPLDGSLYAVENDECEEIIFAQPDIPEFYNSSMTIRPDDEVKMEFHLYRKVSINNLSSFKFNYCGVVGGNYKAPNGTGPFDKGANG